MAKPSAYPKKWTLLFLGSHGRTLHFHQLKLVLVLIGVGFAATAAAALFFYLQYQLQNRHLSTIEASLSDARKEVQRLKKEKEALTLQLAFKHAKGPAGTKLAVKQTRQAPAKPAEQPAAAQTAQADVETGKNPEAASAGASADATKADQRQQPVSPKSKTASAEASPKPTPVEVSKPVEAPVEAEKKREEPVPQRTEVAAPQAAATEPHQSAVVEVKNFRLRKDATGNRWAIRFTVKRTTAATGKISGRAFIVLKDDSTDYNNWVCVPSATMIEGKPAPQQRGYTFSINNYLNARVSMKQQTPPENVREAVVYIYDEKGTLLLEQAFPINN